MAGLKFAELANVQTVGIGFYLALAVIQGIAATGVAGLRRRANTLRTAVVGAKLRSEFTAARRLQADVSRLEISFHTFNRTLLWITAGLFIIALTYFGYTTIWQAFPALLAGTVFVLFYYLVLPISIFLGSSFVIWKRCREVSESMDAAEKRYSESALGG